MTLAAVLAVAIVALTACGRDRSAQAVLEQVVARGEARTFVFEDRPDLAGLRSCFFGDGVVTGIVDQTARRAALRLGGPTAGASSQTTAPDVLVDGDVAYVHRNLLPGWGISTTWLRVERDDDLRPLLPWLPTALARHLTPPQIPDGPVAIVAAALEVSSSTTLIDRRSDATVVRLIVPGPVSTADPTASPVPGRDGGAESESGPSVLDVTVQGRSVTAIRATLDGTGDAGITLRFAVTNLRVWGPPPGTEWTAWPVPAPDTQPPRPRCEVGS